MTASKALPWLLLAAACAPTGPSLTAAEREAVTDDVSAASLALVEAMNAHEPNSILSLYVLDADFTYVGCTDFMFGGDVFATIVGAYHRDNPEVHYDMAVQSVRVLGPALAVVSLRGTSSPDLALFTTRVVRRDGDGRWRVVWEHESWPGCSAPAAPHAGTEPGDSAALTPGGAS